MDKMDDIDIDLDIIKKEQHGNVVVYYVKKNISDTDMMKIKNTFVKPKQIKLIIKDDCDVFDAETDKLLIRFRKNKLSKQQTDTFYENIIEFAERKTSNRGSASASKKKNMKNNPRIMTNILGYYEKFNAKQKLMMQKFNTRLTARETYFTQNYPNEYKKVIPLIQEIDHLYKKYIPDSYEKQYAKAKTTPFSIDNTSFTTVTTNINFQTSIHQDKGDDSEGFGNLAVIEKGDYSGGETCLPQYGVGVDVRTGDILFMDVHEWHGNLPIIQKSKEAKRLSIVCYLRENLWNKTKNKSKKYKKAQIEGYKKMKNKTMKK